jgi:hypothetical protein
MRDRDTIDSELRRLAELRRSIRQHGGELSTRQIDDLLDERLGHFPEASKPSSAPTTGHRAAAGLVERMAFLRRVGLRAALPLSLLAVVVVSVVMFTFHKTRPLAEPAADAPSSAQLSPPASKAPPPSAPKAPASPSAIVDRAFVDALKQEGVPVPSPEYVTSHGHAVCDLLAHQANFDDAVNLVQRTSIWDADQSADVVAGAIVSYCPQNKPVAQDKAQQASQDALTDLQRIEGDLQRIQSDLHGIRDGLPSLPGH